MSSVSTQLIQRFVIAHVGPHALTGLSERFGGILAHQIFFGIPRVCRALVCDLDFALANEWQACLERRQTLAEGD